MPLSVSVSCPEPVRALVTPAFGTGMHSDGVSGNVSDSEKVKRVTVALAEATPRQREHHRRPAANDHQVSKN